MVVHFKVVHLNIIGGGRFSEIQNFLKFTYVWAITTKKGVVHLTRETVYFLVQSFLCTKGGT